MKILFNCFSTKKGGAERVISILANNFSIDNKVVLLTIMNTKDDYNFDKSIKKYAIDKKDYFNSSKFIKNIMKLSPNRLIKMYKIIKKEKPDVIISFLPEPSLRLALLKLLFKEIRIMPTIISIRNDPKIEYHNFIIKNITKILYKNINGFVMQTKDAMDYFGKMINCSEKMIVIPNPIEEKFHINSNKKINRNNIIVTVGRLEKSKNHQLLISAFNRFAQKNNDYDLYIYGDGSLKRELEKQIKELDLTDKIFLKGQVDNIQTLINNSAFFVLPSNHEGMPNALIEAMCLGIPCISTNISGAKELIEDGYNGLLFEVNNEEQLINCMNELAKNEELSNSISKNSRNIYKKLNKSTITKIWNDYILKIIKEG